MEEFEEDLEEEDEEEGEEGRLSSAKDDAITILLLIKK